MDWSVNWLLSGAAAFVLVIVNLVRTARGKRKGWQALLFASLACGVLTMLCEYQMANLWVQNGDFSALEDAVPTMASLTSFAACLGIALNLLALWLNVKFGKER